MTQENSEFVITVRDLYKAYGTVKAVDGVSFHVCRGEIFGMVGPNGAGKTTTIECVEGLRNADGGTIDVLGFAIPGELTKVRPRIGAQLQQSALQPRLRVWEAMDLYAALFPHSVKWDSLLDDLGLKEKRNDYFSKLSGGQKQRLFVALALVGDPEIVFLDELTTGLDPKGRRDMWDLIRQVRDRGKTIFLTTHFMEEAERLCDRVAIMDQGHIVALDTPENLISTLPSDTTVIFVVDDSWDSSNDPFILSIPGVSKVSAVGNRVTVSGKGHNLVAEVVAFLSARSIGFKDLRTETPSLEDVFLALTGRAIKQESEIPAVG